ncbi:MAG TPA: RnfH family protein [Thiotrichaceae bacterium]|jgi:putative ubiquitin-RnfH superfamily antitoxin RatB of RatAB toxin-antitoxin module|nr:RnfH family protein [Thiotrichaceae bacterium]HIM08404.1 RnfH family protein [Gammaproteobacteria bacterium]
MLQNESISNETTSNDSISIELIYIEPSSQNCLKLDVTKGSDIHQVIRRSGLLERFPEIDLQTYKVGIFSKIQSLDTVLQSGDRIEIYRPLQVDPKEARRRRANKK